MEKLKTSPIKGSNWRINVPENTGLFDLHTLAVICGARGSGKSVAATSLLRHYFYNNLLDALIVCSPTYESNKDLLKGLPEPELVLDPDSKH